MHILHIVHQYYPEHTGGTELYTRQLATRQAGLGHDVHVITPAIQSSTDSENGVTVHRVGIGRPSRTATFRSSLYQPTLLNALDRLLPNIDLIHIQHLMGWPFRALDQIRAHNLPYIVTLHDYWFPCANAQLYTNFDETICAGPDEHAHNCGRCVLARGGVGTNLSALAHAVAPLMRGRIKRLRPILANASAVIAPTQFVHDIYRETGFDIPQMTVIPHGIEPPNAPIIQLEGVDREVQFHAVYVGSIAKQKGIHVLIDAFNQLPHDQQFKLTIAGGLDAFPDYVQALNASIQHPGIALVGRIPHEQVWAMLGAADVAIMPTLWYEVSPLTIDEIFATKTPIIASKIGALPEKIRHGVDGLLFPPGDARALAEAIQFLADNRAVLARMKEEIRPINRIEDHVSAVMSLYESAIREQRMRVE